MFHRVLLPVGLSDPTTRIALDAVPEIAADGARVELLHVVEQAQAELDPELEPFYRTLAARAEKQLQAWAESLRVEGYDAEAQVAVGRTVRTILDRVRESGCDLVLMAAHAVSGPEGRLGTVSQQIAVFSPAAVLLVR